MSLKLTNTLTMFQEYINKILVENLNDFYIIYIDDILIYFKIKEEYTQYVNQMFKRL